MHLNNLNAPVLNVVKMDNASFARMEHFKYLGTTLTDQNPIHEETKSGLNLGSTCHSVQNRLSSSLLSKNIRIKTKYTELSICLLFCMGVKLGLSY